MYTNYDFIFEPATRQNLTVRSALDMITALHPEMPRAEKKRIAQVMVDDENRNDYFVSPTFQVAKRLLQPEQHGFGEEMTPTYLSIKRRDQEPFHDWRAMQSIKNAICGPEWEAIEIYPAESRLVDTANQYHLFCWQFTFPIYLFNTREVLTAKQAKAASATTGRKVVQR